MQNIHKLNIASLFYMQPKIHHSALRVAAIILRICLQKKSNLLWNKFVKSKNEEMCTFYLHYIQRYNKKYININRKSWITVFAFHADYHITEVFSFRFTQACRQDEPLLKVNAHWIGFSTIGSENTLPVSFFVIVFSVPTK